MVRRGFSLVEVVVAMLILSIGLLGVAGSGLMAVRMLREAEAREAMLERAATVLDSLITHDIAGAGTVPDPRFRLDWIGSQSSVEVRALLPDGFRFDLTAQR